MFASTAMENGLYRESRNIKFELNFEFELKLRLKISDHFRYIPSCSDSCFSSKDVSERNGQQIIFFLILAITRVLTSIILIDVLCGKVSHPLPLLFLDDKPCNEDSNKQSVNKGLSTRWISPIRLFFWRMKVTVDATISRGLLIPYGLTDNADIAK